MPVKKQTEAMDNFDDLESLTILDTEDLLASLDEWTGLDDLESDGEMHERWLNDIDNQKNRLTHTTRPASTPTYLHMLKIAQEHFLAYGYASVHLHDIAAKLGKKHSAIYYYAPKGKEQLYMLAMEHLLRQYFTCIKTATKTANDNLHTQMQAIVLSLLDLQPISPIRIETLDFPMLCPENIPKMRTWIYEALYHHFRSFLRKAVANEQIELPDANQATTMFFEVIYTQRWYCADDKDMIMQAVDMLLYGWTKR